MRLCDPKDASPSAPIATEAEKSAEVEVTKQEAAADRPPLLPAAHEPRRDEDASHVAPRSVSIKKPQSFFAERSLPAIEIAPSVLRHQSRRDFLAFGAGALATLTAAGFRLPQDTLNRIGIRRDLDSPAKEWLLNRALRSTMTLQKLCTRRIVECPPTRSQITPLKNNYNVSTPDPAIFRDGN